MAGVIDIGQIIHILTVTMLSMKLRNRLITPKAQNRDRVTICPPNVSPTLAALIFGVFSAKASFACYVYLM